MWQLDNRTPFAAERGWLRDRDGAEVWIVAVKATFDVRADGSTAVSSFQPPVLRVPEHHGEAGQSSIKYDADLVLTKTTTDVIVVGAAHAPGERPVTQLDVGVRVGTMEKALRITGDRVWGARGASEARPFVTMPIVYERAYGGARAKPGAAETVIDPRNPVGRGFAASNGDASGVALPNVEYMAQLIHGVKDRPAPAGFGVVASHWQPRVGSAGTYDDKWVATRRPLYPQDLDDRWFQCAPVDQQMPRFLQGGEPVVLVNLSPRGGRLAFTLPTIRLALETAFYDGSREVHAAPLLHTVILEPDHERGARVSLVWHSALRCHAKVQKLARTTIALKGDTVTDQASAATAAREPA